MNDIVLVCTVLQYLPTVNFKKDWRVKILFVTLQVIEVCESRLFSHFVPRKYWRVKLAMIDFRESPYRKIYNLSLEKFREMEIIYASRNPLEKWRETISK